MSIKINKLPSANNILTGSAVPLVVTRDMIRNFGNSEDYVEMHLSDPANKVIYSIVPFSNYTIPGTFLPSVDPATIQELDFNPEQDLKNLNILFGDYKVTYNVLRPVIVKSFNPSLFIKEISGDRTELRLSTNNISNDVLISNTDEFIRNFQSTPYFKEFYLNFGKNQLIPAVNVALDLGPSTITAVNNIGTSALSGPPTVLIKLLNPLPVKYKVNDLLTVVDEIANPQIFSVEITPDTVPATFPTLRGPNFDLDLDNLRVGPTPYYNFNQVTTFSGSFAPQLQQLLGQLSASNFAINIDYDTLDYSDWVHFSSAARRLEGFKYKLSNIEVYTEASASASISASPTALLDAQSYQNKINSTIQSFDGWEQYLYYETGSYSWPKQNSTKPYIVQSVTSSASQIWYSGYHDSASLYDDNNQNYLLYAMPGYITENTDNELAFKFVASIGQMFDDVWIHIKAITDLYQAKNALDQGISKDLVYFALQSMGIDVYTDEDGNNVFQYLYGVNSDGTYKPITGSYDTLISASNYQMSGQDQQKGIYKRLYSNLPLLLKSKGTTRFNQYLNTIFGIPSTIMGYLEYGGVDKVTSSFEYEYDRFTYALQISGSENVVTIPWVYTSQSLARTGYNDIAPNGIEFRFKSQQLPLSYTTQSLFYKGSSFQLDLIYKDTGSNDSIYSGSVGNFGYLKFTLGNSTVTSSTVPVYTTGSNHDTSWYSVLVQRTNPNKRNSETSDSQTYNIYIKNNVWGEIGHVASASLTTNNAVTNSKWYDEGILSFGDGGVYPFSGSLQELRLWSNYVSESTFDSHVLNPESIEGNYTSSAYNDLAARFPLGNNLYTYNHYLTSSVASVAPDQNIQEWTASFSQFLDENNYISFTETYYADVANSGYANPVTDKIRIVSGSLYGTQLLPNKSIVIPDLIPTTKDIHLLDASLSPQDEVDRAIIAQFGSTYNLDEIIGNPSGSYAELQSLQYEFFKKFDSKYNYKDYIRLIEFFHNSLFRTLKDFTPARTNLSTGIVIKPHLLERPVVERPGPYVTHQEETGSIDTAFITGSNGGDYSQSLYPITYKGKFGEVTVTSDASDFFTGILPSASVDVVYTQSNPFTTFQPTNTSSYSESIWAYDYDALLNNVSGSRFSTLRKKAEYITSESRLVQILSTASIEDFTYDYQRHIRPRYEGSSTNGTEYNFFNNNDFDFNKNAVGPFGKNAVIDQNTIQFAYFQEAVATGSQLISMPERTNLYLRYLVDASGSLTELTQRDYDNVSNNQLWNLYQTQTIFRGSDVYQKSGSVNIALFDNQNPSNQKTLDGNKVIWSGGYKFYPMLWKVINTNNAYQIYNVPQGVSTSTFLQASNYTAAITRRRVLLHYGWSEYSTEGTVTYAPAGGISALPYDVEATIRITYWNGFNYTTSNTSAIIARLKADGTPNYTATWRYDRGQFIGLQALYATVIAVRPYNATDPGFVYIETDSDAYLKVHSESIGGTYYPTNIVSLSADMSNLYKANPTSPFYFSGSELISPLTASLTASIALYNTYCPPTYPFTLNVGDLVRFDSASAVIPSTNFKPDSEYVITNVDTSGSRVTFTVDRRVDTANLTNTSSANSFRVERYVFSKRVADETNVIILHAKQPGQTSGGIVKNVNLQLEIDDKIANIVSELKSKIFSTVLK